METNLAFPVINHFQTASPFKIAQMLNVEVRYVELPNQVYGGYTPIRDQQYILLNKEKSSISHRFSCAYHLGVMLQRQQLSLQTLNSPEDYNISSVIFATDLLSEFGEYGSKSYTQHYLENGTPARIVLGIQKLYDITQRSVAHHRYR